MPADNLPRRITIIKVPYNYEFSRASVAVWRKPGEYVVKGEVADHAIANGYALEGWASDTRTRSSKGKAAGKTAGKARATSAAKSATQPSDAAADTGTDASLAGTGVPADDSAALRGAVDEAAK